MTVNLSGLQPGEAGGDSGDDNTDVEITEDTIDTGVVALSGDATNFDKNTFFAGYDVEVGKADDADISATDAYSCMFATVPGADAAEIAEYGITLKNSDNFYRYYPSKNAVEGKFGIFFYGPKDILAKYKAYVYVKYTNGDIVYSANYNTLINE